MIHILAGTNRPESRSLEVSKYIQNVYKKLGEEAEVMSLMDVGLEELKPQHYAGDKPAPIQKAVDTLLGSDGLVVVCPEYNGSMPGALKYFIDQWKYPESFEHRPVSFVRLGGLFGGLRPVEHLQQVFGYRNAFIYPDRVFLMNVWNIFKDGAFTDPHVGELIEKQALGFSRFIKALKSENLHPKGHKS